MNFRKENIKAILVFKQIHKGNRLEFIIKITPIYYGRMAFHSSFTPSLILYLTTNFKLFQTENVRRRQFQIQWNGRKFYKRVENCGKWRNCSFRAISPFPAVFSKDLYCKHVKTRACLGKGINLLCQHLKHLPTTKFNCKMVRYVFDRIKERYISPISYF